MRTQTIELFEFNELSDKAKQRAIGDYQYAGHNDTSSFGECMESIKAFADEFGVNLDNYSIGAHGASYSKTNAENRHFRGCKLKTYQKKWADDKTGWPTGLWLDGDLRDAMLKHWAVSGVPLEAFKSAIDVGTEKIQAQMEHEQSDEYIGEFLQESDYEYFANGHWYTGVKS